MFLQPPNFAICVLRAHTGGTLQPRLIIKSSRDFNYYIYNRAFLYIIPMSLYKIFFGMRQAIRNQADQSNTTHSGTRTTRSGISCVPTSVGTVPAVLSYQANNTREQWKRAFCSASLVVELLEAWFLGSPRPVCSI